jgi:hypothetical protein
MAFSGLLEDSPVWNCNKQLKSYEKSGVIWKKLFGHIEKVFCILVSIFYLLLKSEKVILEPPTIDVFYVIIFKKKYNYLRTMPIKVFINNKNHVSSVTFFL